MDLGYLPDIMRGDVVDFDGLPDRAKEVLALRSLGLSAAKIGRTIQMKKSTVEGYIARYDPNGVCLVTSEAKRVITTEMLMSVAVEALLEITDAKLRVMDAKDCAIIATRCVGAAERIRALDKGLRKQKTELDSAMDYFDAEIEEVAGE